MQITIPKAEPFAGNKPIAPLVINCTDAIPDFTPSSGFEQEYRDYYDGTARTLVDAMLRHIPGGLVDAVLAELMHRKATIYSVPLVRIDLGIEVDK